MSTFVWFDDALALRLLLALLHFLWQGCAVALVVMLAGATLKRSAAHIRYTFHVVAMLVMVACLPVTFTLLHVPRGIESESRSFPRPAAPGTAGRAGDDMSVAASRSSARIPNEQAATGSLSRREFAEWVSSRGSRLLSWLTPLAPTVTAAYFLGVALMSLRLTVALRGGWRLRRSATPVDDSRLLEMIEREVRRMGVKVAPAVAYCERISIPIVVGIVKPAILLPAALASGLSPDQLQALLAHELAHIRRFDLLVNLFQRLAEAVLFFHPAVWFVSRQIGMEREIAADDVVLAAGWQPVQYADALVRMAELSSALRGARIVEQGAALAAWGPRESEFKRRVLRLLAGDDRPMLRLTRFGWTIFLAILIVVALGPLLVQAWAPPADELRAVTVDRPPTNPQGDAPAPAKLLSPAPPTPPSPRTTNLKPDHPRIIIAEHVLLWENQIVTWDEVVKRLRALRKSGPFRATFYTTNGLSGRKDGWRDYHDRIMGLYREVFEPLGVTFASLSPRGSARFDAIRTADDLRPDPTRARPGQVVTPGGEPAQDAQVIVLPTGGPFTMLDVILSGTQLRDPFDEQWSPTDEKGHFVVNPKDDAFLFVVLHASGFAIQAGAAKDEVFRLQPWATLVFNSTGDVADQHANVSIKRPGAKSVEPGFAIYSIETKGKPVEIKVPAGQIALSRSLEMGQGTSISLPVENFSLKPGESRALGLKAPSEADRKRARELYERIHGPRGVER